MNNQNRDKNYKWITIICVGFVLLAIVLIHVRRMRQSVVEPAFEELELNDIEAITCTLGCNTIALGEERNLPEEQWEEFVDYLKKIKIYPYSKVKESNDIQSLSIMKAEGAQIKITFKSGQTEHITIYERVADYMLIEINNKYYYVREMPYSKLMEIVENVENEAVLNTYAYLLEEVPELLQYQTMLENDDNANTMLSIRLSDNKAFGCSVFFVDEIDAEGNTIDRGRFYVSEEHDEIKWGSMETDSILTLEEWRNSVEYILTEYQRLLGKWKVKKYLAEAVEVHVDNISQEEYSATEKIEQEVKEKYLNKVLLIEQENIEQVGSWANEFDSEDYSYEDWESLFLVYRQPLEIELSFPCIGGYFYLKDCEDELNIILDNDNRVYLYIKGLFFQLEKVEE